MDHENISVLIDGSDITDLYNSLVDLEVDVDDDLAGMVKIRFSMSQNTDGTWKNLEDERLRIWKPITIKAGYNGTSDDIFVGYITHVRPAFDFNAPQSSLEIWGMDSSIVMDRQEKLKDWPNKKDSDIASEIFTSYGFTPDVEDTNVVHDETVSTIIQRESDMRFLKRLALRNGYSCFVEGTNASFKPISLSDQPQPVLSVQFGNETNCKNFSLEIDALKSTQVAMTQIDRITKDIIDVSIDAATQTLLGAQDATSLLGTGIDPAKIIIGMNVATGNPEMNALCQGVFHEYSWFIHGQGEIAGNTYGQVLKPRKTVTIKGIGEMHSGVYYVNHVTHILNAAGYSQVFQVKRNALMPTGSENFSASSNGGIL